MTQRIIIKYTLQTVLMGVAILTIFTSGSPAWGFSTIGARQRSITLEHTFKPAFQQYEPMALTLDVTDNAAPREVRCYFYDSVNLNWLFMRMKKTTPSSYSVVLPAINDNLTYFRYFFLVVSNDMRITITKPILRADIIKDGGDVKTTRKKAITRQSYQVFTDTGKPLEMKGFPVGLTAMTVAPSERFGLLSFPLIYSYMDVAEAGGLDTIIRETGVKSVDYYRLEAAGGLDIIGNDQLKQMIQQGNLNHVVFNGDAFVTAMDELVKENATCSVSISDSVILGGLDFTKISKSNIKTIMLPEGMDKRQGENFINRIRAAYGRNAAFRYIPCAVTISDTEIRSNDLRPSIIAKNTLFQKKLGIYPRALDTVVFDRCIFLDDVTFGHIYKGGFTISKSVFYSPLIIDAAVFYQPVKLTGVTLYSSLQIRESNFLGRFNMASSSVNGPVRINRNLFAGSASIETSVFGDGIYLDKNIFRDLFSITNSSLAKDISFDSVDFQKDFVMENSGLEGGGKPTGASARGKIIFKDTSVGGRADFSGVTAGSLEVSRSVFGGITSFHGNDFGSIRIVNWYKSRPSGLFKSLEEGLHHEHRYAEADTAHYMAEKADALRALTGGAGAVEALRAVAWLLWGAPTGYGRLPLYVFFSSAVSVVFFAFFYFSTGCIGIGSPRYDGRWRLLHILNYPARVTDASAADGGGNVAAVAAGGLYSFAADFAGALRYSFSVFFKVGRPGAAAYGICRWAALCQWYAGFIALAAFLRCVAARFGI